MTTSKPDFEKESHPKEPAKAAYSTPRLESLGSLRSATRGTAGGGSDGGKTMTMMSDPRAKDDIAKVGRHALGLGIYRFRYKAPFDAIYGTDRRIGVMADEVAAKYPEAVSRDYDGFLSVDYARLFH